VRHRSAVRADHQRADIDGFEISQRDVKFVKQERSSSFQRLSGVPINPPVSPLSARMIP
jgi:hypothetical protein